MIRSRMLLKKTIRAIFRVIPPTQFSFNFGKLITRTALRPEPSEQESAIRFFGKVPMTVNLGEFVGNDLYCFDKHYESRTIQLWRRLARDSKVILDLGGHIGTFALTAAYENPSAIILVAEPCKRNLRYLTTNIRNFKNIRLFEVAISPVNGDLTFYEDEQSGGGFLQQEHLANADSSIVSSPMAYSVSAITPAHLCEQAGVQTIDLLKMDLEGLEYSLLTGQNEFWEQYAPTHVIVEINYPKKNPSRLDSMLNAMRSRGYHPQRYQNLYAFPWTQPNDLANWYFSKI